jgi:multiple sugar transport system substrate-binding protein
MKLVNIFILLLTCPLIGVPSNVQIFGQHQSITLKIMNYSTEEIDFYQDVSRQFNKEYPGIILEFVSIQNTEYKKQLPLLFQKDSAPDIFTFHSDGNWVLSMSELISRGWISSLGTKEDLEKDWMGRWPERSFVEGINIYNDSVYGFPYTKGKIRGTGYMFTNTAVLKKAGIDEEFIPKTWEAFVEMCEKIKQNTGIYPLVIPMKTAIGIRNTWTSLAGAIKTDQFFDYQKGRFAIDNPDLIQAFNFIKKLYDLNLIMPGFYDNAKARREFGTGNAAFIFDSSYLPNVLKSKMNLNTDSIQIGRPPYPDHKPHGAIANRNTENKIWISSQTKHLKEARLFIEWMTRPGGYYALEYMKRSLGILAFCDHEKYRDQLPFQLIQLIEASKGLKLNYPEPIEKCSDLSKSKAFQAAEEFHPGWEWDVIYKGLFGNENFVSLVNELTKKKNEVFKKTLLLEKEEGLDISKECYQFPDWKPKKTKSY